MHRAPSTAIADPAACEPWGYRDGAWDWGNPPTPVLDGAFGEMCLRPLDGKWVLTWFDAGGYRIDGIIMDTPTSNLHTAHRRTLVHGGAWGARGRLPRGPALQRLPEPSVVLRRSRRG
ncbi:DUF4185 domain-containing protein [Nocardiopsis sp. JB363]|uniref:DUF4185 domain-containing protein n=1 Tax=Nocardiopsis sp. JB363 TaxID=1434837 RepID=UPI000979ED22|nr:DUF4185 domain-containing protein [Nocardiopsis sp. JB363]SIO87775.1 secreted protein [Nocardiopsis sp. JB363]